jgi:hypothetical protein
VGSYVSSFKVVTPVIRDSNLDNVGNDCFGLFAVFGMFETTIELKFLTGAF